LDYVADHANHFAKVGVWVVLIDLGEEFGAREVVAGVGFLGLRCLGVVVHDIDVGWCCECERCWLASGRSYDGAVLRMRLIIYLMMIFLLLQDLQIILGFEVGNVPDLMAGGKLLSLK